MVTRFPAKELNFISFQDKININNSFKISDILIYLIPPTGQRPINDRVE